MAFCKLEGKEIMNRDLYGREEGQSLSQTHLRGQ